MSQNLDPELDAIKAMISSLAPLQEAERMRALRYVIDYLGISIASSDQTEKDIGTSEATSREKKRLIFSSEAIDIKRLKELKSPKTAQEMAALVAFYLSEKAPIEERQNEITKDDIDKYFRQAGYSDAKSLKDILVDAAKSGYFERVAIGKYKLTTVGYNLVAYSLPRANKN